MMTPSTRSTRRRAGANRSALMAAVTAAIAPGSITPTTSRIAISPAQLALHWMPRRKPDRQATPLDSNHPACRSNRSRQRRRWRAFHAEHWNTPAPRITIAPASGAARASTDKRITTVASVAPHAKAATPATVHTRKYPAPICVASQPGQRAPASRLTWR
jgi:hypothetical protein